MGICLACFKEQCDRPYCCDLMRRLGFNSVADIVGWLFAKPWWEREQLAECDPSIAAMLDYWYGFQEWSAVQEYPALANARIELYVLAAIGPR